MNELTTFRWTFDEDVHNYLAAGVRCMAVWRQKLADYGEERGIELLRDHGMSVSSLLWAGGFTGSDGRTYRESVADAREAIRLAGQLACRNLIVYAGARGGHTLNHAKRLIRNALRELTSVAYEHGVVMAIEPMHAGCASDWTFLTDLDQTLELIDEINEECVGLAFDSYHLGHDPAVVGRIPEFVDRIAIVQLGDARQPPRDEQDRCPLGDGQLPIREIIGQLRQAGYRGFYDVELMGEEIEHQCYDDLVRRSVASFSALSEIN